MANPIDEASSQIARTARIYWRRGNGLFSLLSRIPIAEISTAIRRRSVVPIVRGSSWIAAIDYVRERAIDRDRWLLTRSIQSGYREAGIARGIRSRSVELSELAAPQHAIDRIQAIDRTNRAGVRRLVTDAANQYRQSPSISNLRRLANEIQGKIGVTSKQANYITKNIGRLREAGYSDAAIDSFINRKVNQYTQLRAQQIADRSVIESIGRGRQLAWQNAIETGEISSRSKKQWMTQGDENVRRLHDAQRQSGPIPISEIFEIMGVLHPPSDEFG